MCNWFFGMLWAAPQGCVVDRFGDSPTMGLGGKFPCMVIYTLESLGTRESFDVLGSLCRRKHVMGGDGAVMWKGQKLSR